MYFGPTSRLGFEVAIRSRFGVFPEVENLGVRCFVTFPRPRAEAGNCAFPVSGMLFPNAPFLTFERMKGNIMPGSWNRVLWEARVRIFPWILETSGMEPVARSFGTSKMLFRFLRLAEMDYKKKTDYNPIMSWSFVVPEHSIRQCVTEPIVSSVI